MSSPKDGEPESSDHSDYAVGKQARKRPYETDEEPVGKPKISPCPCDYSYENCPSLFLVKFLEPLLRDGGENLYDWLLKKNLLKTPPCCIRCRNKSLDLHYVLELWKCEECKGSFSVRKNSFFYGLPYSIRDILYCVMAWIHNVTSTVASKDLNIRYEFTQQIYQRCIETIISYFKEGHCKNWSLGGTGSVALLDLWPNGYIPIEGWREHQLKKKSYYDRLRVLWMADTNHVPVRCFAHLLPPQKNIDKVLLEFEKIKKDFDLRTNEAVNLISSGPQQHDEIEKEISAEDINNSSYSGENQLQKLEPRVLREQQEVAITPEDGRPQKRDMEKKSNLKRKNQVMETLSENIPIDDPQNFISLIEDESKEDVSPHLEMKIEDENSIIHDKVDEQKADDNLISSAVNVDKEHVATKGKSKRKRNKPPLTEAEKLEKAQLEEYMRDIALAHDVLPVALDYIASGSLVVVNDETLPYVACALHKLGKYESVTTVNDLISTGDPAAKDILKNIWKDAAVLCKDLLKLNYNTGRTAVAIAQWRRLFDIPLSEALYHLLSQIASHYDPENDFTTQKKKEKSSKHYKQS